MNLSVQGPTCQRYAGNLFTMPEPPQQPDQQTRDRRALRQRLRARRRAVSPERRRAAATAAAGRADSLPSWRTAASVACYLATPEEFDCGPLLAAAWRANKQTFLPAMGAGRHLVFRRYTRGDALQARRYGIRQPADTAPIIDAAALDILFLPLVGWNAWGARLGMGGGYYDRTLAQGRPGILVGLGYDCQEYSNLTLEAWDVPVDYVLTESRLIDCAG